ncbi:MAG TPA: outer membrane protein assembly factor BamA [Acidobacteriota bacterium]|nr:outer membrane protein assembly factor BamA [Acidobacteriota bacterium]
MRFKSLRTKTNGQDMELMSWLQKLLNRTIFFIFTVLILSLSFTPSYAQTGSTTSDILGQFQFNRVGTITLQADGPIDKPALLDLIELTPNVDILTTSKIRKSIELLYATGNFSNIIVDAEKQDDHVNLTFVLRLIYRFESIDVDGPGGPPYGKIRKALTLRKFEPYLPEKVLRGREQILEALRNNGFMEARVTPDVLLLRPEKRAKVDYIVTPGPAAYVASIVFSGSRHFPQETLLSLMKTKPPHRFIPYKFERDLEKIEEWYDKNGFLEHKISEKKREVDASNRVHLEIEIEAGKPVQIEVTGFKLSDTEIDENIPVRIEHSYNDDTLEEGKRNLTQFLQKRGYYDAEVDYRKVLSNEYILIRYEVTPGPKYKVEDISIAGNQHLSEEKLLDMITTKESGLFSKHLVQRDFEADQGKILGAYREEGFLFARFVKNDVIRHPEEGKIDIQIEIDEGPQVILSEYRFQGNEVVSSDELKQQLSQKVAKPVSESKIKNDSRYIVALYSERGYPKMQASNRILLSRDKTRAIIEYNISEGEQIFVDRIVVSGNYRTKLSIIEDTLLLQEDDPLSLRKVAASQSKLYGLELFDRVDIEMPRPDNLQPHQPLRIHLVETRPYTIAYGAGFESYNKLNGVFSISNRNWLGLDRIIALQMRGGFNEGRAVASYNDPHLLGEETPINISGIYENRSPRNTFSYSLVGATVQIEKRLSADPAFLEVGQRVPPLSSVFLTYAFEDINNKGTPELTPQERRFLDIHISSITGSYVRDARDNPIDPFRGSFFSSSLEWATNVLGSQTDFLKWFNQFQYYLTVQKGSVIASSLRVGLAEGFRETVELPLSRRFFAGGGRTIRGFELDTAGPLDENGEPLGGNAVVVVNLEYRFPLVKSLGAVVFFDYGSAFTLIEDINFEDMRETAGLGLRYHTPIGPLTLDWGYKLDRRFTPIRESSSEFFLSVGHAF